MINARETAFNIVYGIIYEDKYSNMFLESNMSKADLSAKDRGFCMNLSLGTIKNSIYLKHLLSKYIKDMGKLQPKLLVILELGIYQNVFMDKVPEYAIADECCNLAKKIIGRNSASFVNGVLRNFFRAEYKDDESLPPYIRYSCTKEAYDVLVRSLGKDKCIEVLKKFNLPSDTYVRINTHFHDEDAVIESLTREGYTVLDTGSCMLRIKGSLSPMASSAYKEGAIYVQDEGAMSIADSTDVKEGMDVLDACAAPGGKSIAIANMMKNTGHITACDAIPGRVALMESFIKRSGFTNIKCYTKDMTIPVPEFFESFDRILIDAPCSGLGVAGKRPEIKLKYRSSADLIKTQKALLKTCSDYVRKDGILVYGTCTLNKDENECVIYDFLSLDDRFTLIMESNEEGFYYAKMHKQKA